MALYYGLANTILDENLYTPATPYLMLHTAAPDAEGAGSEAQKPAAAGDMARVAVTFGEAAADAAAEKQVSANTAAVTIAAAAIASGQTITHFSIWDALTSGNCLFVAAVTSEETTGTGGVEFGIGDLKVSLSVYLKEPEA